MESYSSDDVKRKKRKIDTFKSNPDPIKGNSTKIIRSILSLRKKEKFFYGLEGTIMIDPKVKK